MPVCSSSSSCRKLENYILQEQLRMIQHKPVLASFGTKGVAALNDLGAPCCWEPSCRFEVGAAAAERLQQDKRSCSRIRDVEGHFKTEYYIKSRIMIFCWGSNCSTTAWGQNNCSTGIALEDNLTEIVTSMMKNFSGNFKNNFQNHVKETYFKLKQQLKNGCIWTKEPLSSSSRFAAVDWISTVCIIHAVYFTYVHTILYRLITSAA